MRHFYALRAPLPGSAGPRRLLSHQSRQNARARALEALLGIVQPQAVRDRDRIEPDAAKRLLSMWGLCRLTMKMPRNKPPSGTSAVLRPLIAKRLVPDWKPTPREELVQPLVQCRRLFFQSQKPKALQDSSDPEPIVVRRRPNVGNAAFKVGSLNHLPFC